jgi:hypothetical protein
MQATLLKALFAYLLFEYLIQRSTHCRTYDIPTHGSNRVALPKSELCNNFAFWQSHAQHIDCKVQGVYGR